MNHSPFACPRCRSDNTSSYEMIVQNGTATGNFSSVSYGGGAGTVGTGGLQNMQSALARNLLPPIKPSYSSGEILMIIFAGGGAFILNLTILSVILTLLHIVPALAVPLALTAGIVAVVFTVRKISPRVAERIENWNKQIWQWRQSWICLRCGHRWLMPDAR